MAQRRRAKQPAKENERSPLLRRADQAVVAALVMLSLAGMAGYYVVQGGLRDGLIEIDRASPREARFRVDLNQAEWPELSQLPEVESRSLNGPFKDNDELQRVRGIGPRTMERIKPYLLPRPSQQEVAGGSAVPSENLP
jgi:competence protein ComEA